MNQSHIENHRWIVGIARKRITPPNHVELAGLGYYLKRTGNRINDDLNATALVVGEAHGKFMAMVALDILYCDESFARQIRANVAAETNIRPDAICINCSHSHNAPTTARTANRGIGEYDEEYVEFAAKMAVEAVILAWQNKMPAKICVGSGQVHGIAFNRTRENGPIDHRLSILRVDTIEGTPLAVIVNHHTHLNAHLDANRDAISRDLAGEVVDQLEAALPGTTAMYLQGICGDVMLLPEFTSTDRSAEPALEIVKVAIAASQHARVVECTSVQAATLKIRLPTRRWTLEEINGDRNEALHRLQTGDTKDWLKGFARVIVTYPDRLPDRYGGSVEKAVAAVSRFGVEWTNVILADYKTRPLYVETEVQAIRIGDVWFVANSAELFTSLGMEVRAGWPYPDLFMLGYSNGAIGYLPDAHDVERKSYAAYQSPKFTGQFPFTSESGKAMVEGLLNVLRQTVNQEKLN